MGDQRDSLRKTFDAAAATYQASRPDYPRALFDDLVTLTGITPPGYLLEVGCGPGKATLPLARRGFRIIALELGPALVQAARDNLRGFPLVEVVGAEFEAWSPPEQATFDLAYAATAWSWVDPETKYPKAASLLRPGGHLAVWGAGHAFPKGYDPFFDEIQAVYDEIGEGHPGEWPPPPPDESPDEASSFTESGLFDVVAVRRYLWSVDYTADTYLALLDTFSGHIAMEDAKRHHLYREIRRRIGSRPDGTIHRHWMAALTVGRLCRPAAPAVELSR